MSEVINEIEGVVPEPVEMETVKQMASHTEMPEVDWKELYLSSSVENREMKSKLNILQEELTKTQETLKQVFLKKSEETTSAFLNLSKEEFDLMINSRKAYINLLKFNPPKDYTEIAIRKELEINEFLDFRLPTLFNLSIELLNDIRKINEAPSLDIR